MKDYLKKYHIIFGFFLLILLFENCARVGSPSGGPKDEKAPEVINSKPENYSTGFKQSHIEIEFNEFIQLKNINQELVISPPIKKKPLVKLRNKFVIVTIEGDLLDSTTYTLNFGQAITDNNEGNPIDNFEFVFSTGSYIDSLGVSGIILNAFDLKPLAEPVTVMLYDILYDSVPYKDLPINIGKTTKDGRFMIKNLKSGSYKMFALKDGNYNLIYDLPDENIAFLDTSFLLSPELVRDYIDSVKVLGNTVHTDLPEIARNDTLEINFPDTLVTVWKNLYPVSFELFLFQEDKRPQYLLDYKRSDPKKLEFYFNRPLTDSLIIEPLNFKYDRDGLIFEQHLIGDTLYYWIRDAMIYKQDSLKMHLRYEITDSVLNYKLYDDTLNLVFTPEISKRKKQQAKIQEGKYLQIQTSIKRGSIQDVFRRVEIVPEYPVAITDISKIKLFKKVDTLEYSQSFQLKKDTFHLRKYWLDHNWEESMDYRLFIKPGAFVDIYGLINDTTEIPFKTQSMDHYGKVILTIANVKQDIILQLMSEKEDVISVKTLTGSGIVDFSYLEPGKYKLKLIYDSNQNGKWDTGRYLDKRQPEKVLYFKELLTVRANWDLDIKWDIKEK